MYLSTRKILQDLEWERLLTTQYLLRIYLRER